METMPLHATLWLIAGGMFYSIGTIFFIWEALPFNHAIWHVFVMLGSICHYFSIFTVVLSY